MRHSILTLVLLSLCGVCSAAPTNPHHDPEGHGLEQHQELQPYLFCFSSYVLLWQMMELDPGTPTLAKLEIRRRGVGLGLDVYDHVTNTLGHTEEQLDVVYTTMHEAVTAQAEADFDLWLELAAQAGCREMTQTYADRQPL